MIVNRSVKKELQMNENSASIDVPCISWWTHSLASFDKQCTLSNLGLFGRQVCIYATNIFVAAKYRDVMTLPNYLFAKMFLRY